MSVKTLPKGYEPSEVEDRWRSHWEENKTFTPADDATGEPFSIVIPPPNVTGALHIGHALNITLQDILCRFARQKGRKVLWVPGMDHAGIATQNVVERKLKEESVSREDLGRDKFIDQVWEWKEEYGGRILNQIRKLGASVDWTRERFTMDDGLSRAVREVFVTLYEEGLIYRGEYIINWCTRCHTALADDEVEHAPKKGNLYYIRYPMADGSGELIVATTRPETMLGDTAVAVHPEDERYNKFIGKEAILPLVGRALPVIGDSYVDREFGTGALKVTPAHDMNDWELGRKHGLDVVSVMDDAGNMCEAAGERYQGMNMIGCRERVVADLKKQGYLVKVEEHEHKVGECYRCKTVIEPHVSKQWFVAVKPLAEKARAAVDVGDTKIFPELWTKTYYNWLDNIRDWCISRQLWWGHRIPVWYCDKCDKLTVSREDPVACECGGNLTQDEDVLDTWFSSALWPFSTLGWPDKTAELDTYYPTSVLVTGFDILFFWVARMMMMGLHFMGDVPFKDVYIHALVRDEEGKKMSKSTGNVIDPLQMIDRYGCDSLRFTLTAFAAMGRDIKLSEARIQGYRHFMNKLWNAARFTLMNLGEDKPTGDINKAEGLHHRYILSRLEDVKVVVDGAVTGYAFNEAAQTLYQFVWHEFCDWYLEMIKLDLSSGDEAQAEIARTVLWTVLSETLVLMHPIAPFVTQEIWNHLPGLDSDLALEPFPGTRPEMIDKEAEELMGLVQELVVSVRNIRGELNIAPSFTLDAVVRTVSDKDEESILANADLIRQLARVGELSAGRAVAAPKASASAVVRENVVYVPLSGAVDFEAELARLDKELAKAAKELEVVGKKLANEDFVSRAPEAVVGKEREKQRLLTEKRDKLASLKERLAGVLAQQ